MAANGIGTTHSAHQPLMRESEAPASLTGGRGNSIALRHQEAGRHASGGTDAVARNFPGPPSRAKSNEDRDEEVPSLLNARINNRRGS